MRTYCNEAATYGNVPIAAVAKPANVLVILNPTANKRTALETVSVFFLCVFAFSFHSS